MKNKNISFVISVLIVVTSLFLLDLTVGRVGEYALSKMPDFAFTQISKDNYRLNRVNKDIVIVGSSRCSRHYVSTMLRDSINSYVSGNYSLFNCGVDGRPVDNNLCAAEAIMDRYTPELLIFDVSEQDLTSGPKEEFMEDYSVFYKDNVWAKKYIDDLGWKERVKMSSNMFRFNRRIAHIVQSFVNETNEDGYEPIYQIMEAPSKETYPPKKSSHIINEKSLENFRMVLQTAKENGVFFIVVSSPRFRSNDGNLFLAELCHSNGIPYLDMQDIDQFNDHPEYFKDASHLNDNGAHVFTELFFQELKPLLFRLKH